MFIRGQRIAAAASGGLLLLAGSLAACGGGEDAATPAASATAAATATPERVEAQAVYIVDVETLAVERVRLPSRNYFGPSWSPDGSKIAVNSFADLYVFAPDGSGFTQITENGCSNYLPAWSPDGRTMVFVSDCGGPARSEELSRIDVDGGNEVRLTHDTAWDYRADWSPDGSMIMFGSERDEGWQILTMRPDGSDQAPLPTPAHGNAISWSRAGVIAFTSDRDGDDDIYVMQPDGSGQRNLTNNAAHDDNAAWSPDGTRIAFSSDRSAKNEIYVMDADGGNARQLTTDARLLPNIPTWSADGRRIAFSAEAVTPE